MWLYLRMERNHSPNSHQKIWRNNGLRTGVVLGVISDITQRILLMDVRSDPQQDTHPQVIISSNFLMWIWGVISFYSSKKSPVFQDQVFLVPSIRIRGGHNSMSDRVTCNFLTMSNHLWFLCLFCCCYLVSNINFFNRTVSQKWV